MKLFQKKEENPLNPFDLSQVLYQFAAANGKASPIDSWRLEDCVRGVQIFGGIGSGKSSGSGRNLALTFLRNGFGGIVLTGKVDEKDVWIRYAKETGREDDLVIFESGSPYKFNPLAYELSRDESEGGGQTDNLVNLFMAIVKMGNRMDGGGDVMGKEPFWALASSRSLKATLDLLKLADKAKQVLTDEAQNSFGITIANIAKILRDSPTGEGHYSKFFKLSSSHDFEQHQALQKWADQSYTIYGLSWASAYIKSQQDRLEKEAAALALLKSSNEDLYAKALVSHQIAVAEYESEQRTYEVVCAYFLSELPTLADKTRSSILEHFFAFAAPFRSGMLADYFATETSPEVLPEESFKGKIIILNFPVKQFLQLGIYAQCIYKKLWQQAVERRVSTETTRPVFQWIDESQYFVNSDDMIFQTTARASRACTVLLTQNISNYYAMMGGSNAKAFVDSLLGNLGTKILHNNSDAVMNEWAAELIAKDYRGNLTVGSDVSTSEEYQHQVLPKAFTLLKTGGKTNDGIVEAVVTVAGKRWSNGKNYLQIIFNQDLK